MKEKKGATKGRKVGKRGRLPLNGLIYFVAVAKVLEAAEAARRVKGFCGMPRPAFTLALPSPIRERQVNGACRIEPN